MNSEKLERFINICILMSTLSLVIGSLIIVLVYNSNGMIGLLFLLIGHVIGGFINYFFVRGVLLR